MSTTFQSTKHNSTWRNHETEGRNVGSISDLSHNWSAVRKLYCFFIKRWIDLTLASLALIFLAPVLAAAALAIWLETRGTIIFRQDRVGINGKRFVIYKFCTMRPDYRKANVPITFQDRRTRHKSKEDPRVTGIGKFLRRTSVDELPQLLNVVRGEMSLIGPRPELPEIVARYVPWQHQRHLVRPGLTGWWQIHGRSERPMHENTELDIYYVENHAFPLDLKIFVLTFRALLTRSGAF